MLHCKHVEKCNDLKYNFEGSDRSSSTLYLIREKWISSLKNLLDQQFMLQIYERHDILLYKYDHYHYPLMSQSHSVY